MWIYTKHGFFSVVQHSTQPDHVLLRARAVEDITLISSIIGGLGFDKPTFQYTSMNDYAYRLVVPKTTFAALLNHLALSMSYTNFKNAAHDGTDRDAVYMSVWSTMRGWQETRQRKQAPPRKTIARGKKKAAAGGVQCGDCGWIGDKGQAIQAGLNYILCPACESSVDLGEKR